MWNYPLRAWDSVLKMVTPPLPMPQNLALASSSAERGTAPQAPPHSVTDCWQVHPVQPRTGTHSCCEFMMSVAGSRSEDSPASHLLLLPSFCTLSLIFPELRGGDNCPLESWVLAYLLVSAPWAAKSQCSPSLTAEPSCSEPGESSIPPWV